jgi:hypothetical protein
MNVRCYGCEGTGREDGVKGAVSPCSWCEGRGELNADRTLRELAAEDPDMVERFMAHVGNEDPALGEALNALFDSLAWREDPWGRKAGRYDCSRCGGACTEQEVKDTYDADYQGEESGYVEWVCCSECMTKTEAA